MHDDVGDRPHGARTGVDVHDLYLTGDRHEGYNDYSSIPLAPNMWSRSGTAGDQSLVQYSPSRTIPDRLLGNVPITALSWSREGSAAEVNINREAERQLMFVNTPSGDYTQFGCGRTLPSNDQDWGTSIADSLFSPQRAYPTETSRGQTPHGALSYVRSNPTPPGFPCVNPTYLARIPQHEVRPGQAV